MLLDIAEDLEIKEDTLPPRKPPLKLHGIAGMPRAGSTLLCNILNQNSDFSATSTDNLVGVLSSIIDTVSNAIEIKQQLHLNKKVTEDKIKATLRGAIEGWHDHNTRIVFNKSREWPNRHQLIRELYPNFKLVMMVRDLRGVLASTIKQHEKTPFFQLNTGDNILIDRYLNYVQNGGFIGTCAKYCCDMNRTDRPGVLFIRYEDLIKNPEAIMRAIYEFIDEPYYEHHFEDVRQTVAEVDSLYLNKYPHRGIGTIKDSEHNEWKQYVSNDISELILSDWKFYCNLFGYSAGGPIFA